MDLFHAMRVFNTVVETNSFSLAADRLGLPRATVTTTIQSLEKHLQTRLLNRTTRKISLTADGAVYYDRSIQILADVEDVESNFHDSVRGPRGKLRIDITPSLGRLILIPMLCEFKYKFPDLELVIGMNDRPVDLVQEAVDCVIRIGQLKDSSLVARRIGIAHFVTVASDRYFEEFGVPERIEDLSKHQVVHFFNSRTGRNIDWNFVVNEEIQSVAVNGKVSVNDTNAYIDLALQGFGLIQCPYYMVAQHIESGALKEVLKQQVPQPLPISVIYLKNRHLSNKVRTFVDWAAQLFAECPLLNGSQAILDHQLELSCQQSNKTDFTFHDLVEQHNKAEEYSLSI